MRRTCGCLAWLLAGALGATALTGCGGDLFGQKNPEDARFTILLRTHGSPTTHVQESELFRKRLTEVVGWKDVFIIHKPDHSELCWGTYPTIAAAKDNLRTAQNYVAPSGEKVFELAIILPLPEKDVGPPEWNIQNAKGTYTVLIAEFFDVPEANPPYLGRKNIALDYCKQLRDKGEEAYYFHGPAKSFVYVGAFPASAVKKVELNGVVRPVVQDPKMLDVLKTHPFLAVNGCAKPVQVVNPVTGKVSVENAGSYPEPIPQKGQVTSQPLGGGG